MPVTTQKARNSWIEYVADGTATGASDEFPIPFGSIDPAHIVVKDNGVTKVQGTDYQIHPASPARSGVAAHAKPYIVWGTAPTNTNVIKVSRETPSDALTAKNPEIGNIAAMQAFYLAQEAADRPTVVPFAVPATELAAGTAIDAYSPVDGVIDRMVTVVQTAIGTGGAVTAKVGTTAVAGLSVAVASSATKGTINEDSPTSGDASAKVKRGDRLQIVPSSAFATAGALVGYLEIYPNA